MANAPAGDTVYSGGTATTFQNGKAVSSAPDTVNSSSPAPAPVSQMPVGISEQNPTGLVPYSPANPQTPAGPAPLVTPPADVAALNAARQASVDKGENAYEGDQATLAAFDAASGGSSNPITSTSGNARTDESNLGGQITSMSDPNYQSTPNSAMSYLDNFSANLSADYANQQSSINASSDSQEAQLSAQQKNDTGAESSSLARMGGYLGPTASGNGAMLGLAATQRTQMQALEAARQKALTDAATAYQSQNFALAQAKVAEAQKYEEDAYTQHQDFLAQTAAIQKTQTDQANEGLISGIMAKGVTDPNAIFQALNGAVPIADIESFIKSATPPATPGSAFNFTTADTAKLLGAGLTASDIANVNAYVTQNGYTDQFRASLTPSERQVLDGIYRPKIAGASSSGSSDTTFSKSQLNKGAANAGMTLSDFSNLSDDDKNQFVNSYSAFSKEQTAISKGTTTAATVWQQINSSNLSDTVKAIYAKKLGIDTTAATAGSGNNPSFLQDLESWAGDAWKTITGA